MNDIEFGILMNFIFWIVALPAVVIFVVWVCVAFFEAMDNSQGNIQAGDGKGASPHPSIPNEGAEEQYRKSA